MMMNLKSCNSETVETIHDGVTAQPRLEFRMRA